MKIRDSNIVKIAVESENLFPKLIEFNQKQPLATIIQDLCTVWELSPPDQYALQFSDNRQNYVTEKNRNEIKNGVVLRLTFSPSKTALDILQKLNSGSNEEKTAALQQLSKLSTDITFASEFINKQGLTLIISLIEQKKCQDLMLAYCLQSFTELMDHGIVSWDILESSFIVTVASYVNNHSKTLETKVIEAALSILESIVLNSTGKYVQVEKQVTLASLVFHLENSNPVVQQNTIALINALFSKADPSRRKEIAAILWSKQVRVIILTKIIGTSSDQIGAEMAHQLYVLQTGFLGLLEQRMNTKMDPQDQESHEKIKELRKIAFEIETNGNTDGLNRKLGGTIAKDYKKLGFKYDINPALDFNETPPGLLALDCMYYFAKNHVEAYTKVVLENSYRQDEHECPFGRTSVELVKLLCQILRIGETPNEQNITYYPMFFTHDHPFEEFYCICIILLNKTWKEMRATVEDFTKVFGVVREQITRALQEQPINFEKLKLKLQTLPYSEIIDIWQKERITREEWESHARPIVQLKEIITPEIVDLIQKQRLGFLVEGTRFTKYSSRGQRIKDKFWYVRLSPNHKVFHYGDCDEKSTPSIDELPNKLQIADIKALVTGKDCPHMKDLRGRNNKATHHLAFSLTYDSIEANSLDFVAPDEQIFDYWTDGVNALLRNKMNSKEAEKDLETLLSMEIKLRLLDAEGINIPQDPPVIPPDPPNYDFALEFK